MNMNDLTGMQIRNLMDFYRIVPEARHWKGPKDNGRISLSTLSLEANISDIGSSSAILTGSTIPSVGA